MRVARSIVRGGPILGPEFDKIMVMKHISIQDLKAGLSGAVAEAEAGETLIITRHNEPVARLVPADPHEVHRGKSVGTERLRPAVRRSTGGRYLIVLSEDRGNR
jgi:prevent-host-death family protein